MQDNFICKLKQDIAIIENPLIKETMGGIEGELLCLISPEARGTVLYEFLIDSVSNVKKLIDIIEKQKGA